MRWSQAFIPTLREAPADAESASHRLLLRGGYIRQTGSGIFAHLLLAQKSFLKITRIIREELERIGGQEIGLPVPAGLSICGHDDLPYSARIWPGLTTVHQPAEEMLVSRFR